MKATIDAEGMLRISPENDTEHYALKCWWESYQGSKGNAGIALEIEYEGSGNDPD